MKLGVIMDPIGSINIAKDTTFEMLWQAQLMGWSIQYMEIGDLYVENGTAKASMNALTVFQDSSRWFSMDAPKQQALADLDCILMRKDPPFDMEYIYATYILELAENSGCLIVNKPQALRDCNEKAYCSWFPDLCPKTLITRQASHIKRFLDEQNDIIIKPLDGMGGSSIFRIQQHSKNINVIIETLTHHGTRFAMVQSFIPEIDKGDKRILIVDGTVVPYCLARIPAQGETRGNLAAGGKGVAQALSHSDFALANKVAPELKKRGIYFAGLDVIGSHLTEINVTSPTCVKEINAAFSINIAKDFLVAIQSRVAP